MGKGGYIMKTLHKEEEEKKIIIPAHYHHNEEDNHKPHVKQLINSLKERLVEGVAMGAGIAAMIGVLFSASQLVSEQPNLNLEKPRVDIQSPENIPKIIKNLDEIELNYSDVTGMVIINLREDVELLLEKQLEIKIPDVGETDNSVNKSWLNQNSLDEEDIRDIKNMINASINTIEENKDSYESENDNNSVERLDEIKEKLEKLSPTDSVQQKQIDKTRIVMDLLVKNRSNSKNWIRDTVVIRFYNNQKQSFPVTLYLKKNQNQDQSEYMEEMKENQSTDIAIDGNSLKQLRFESDLLDNLDSKHKNFLKSAFENEYNYIFALEDIKDNIWSVEGTLLPYDLNFQSKKLEYETEMLLKKKDSLWFPWK